MLVHGHISLSVLLSHLRASRAGSSDEYMQPIRSEIISGSMASGEEKFRCKRRIKMCGTHFRNMARTLSPEPLRASLLASSKPLRAPCYPFAVRRRVRRGKEQEMIVQPGPGFTIGRLLALLTRQICRT